jgi:hypothetical protein
LEKKDEENMSQTSSKQQESPKSVLLSQSWTQAELEALSAEQLDLYSHEVEWILKQLADITPTPNEEEKSQQSSCIEELAVSIQDSLMLERLRRQVLYVQEEISNLAKNASNAVAPNKGDEH